MRRHTGGGEQSIPWLHQQLIGKFGLVLLFLFLLLTAASCEGADLSATDCRNSEFVVNSYEDIDDGACNAGNCTLREAVEAANTCTVHPSYTIILPEGDYELMLRGPGDERGDFDLRRNVAIKQREGDTSLPVIEGPDTWNDRIFHIHPEVEAYFENLWIRGGDAGANGGGVLNQGILDIDRAIISHNRTSRDGGGLYNDGLATLEFVEFFQNFANPVDYTTCGGAIFNAGQLVLIDGTIHQGDAYTGAGICNQAGSGGSLLLQGTWIENNGGTVPGLSGLGGGIASFRGPVTLERTTIVENVALRGGGFYATNGELEITDSTISENRAGFGGGLFIGPSASNVRIHQTTIEGNLAERRRDRTGEWDGGLGGGVLLATNDFDLLQSPIENNVAEMFGAAIYLQDPSGGPGFYSHAAITGNSSPNGSGAGIYNASGNMLVANATLSGNEGLENGIAFYNGSGATSRLLHVTIADTHLSEFVRNISPVYNEDGGRLTLKNSLIVGIGSGSACRGDRTGIFSEGGNGLSYRSLCADRRHVDDIEVEISFPSPVVLPLAEIDGTLVHPLPADSRLIDFIDPPECNRDDQRMATRPQGDGCEPGAYEMEMMAMGGDTEGITIPTPTPGQESTPTATPACPAVTTFSEASFGSISYRQGQGETLVVLEVAAAMEQEVYPASINGQSFQCSQSAEVSERLFCIGPRLVEGAQATLELFADGCSQPVFETIFSVPLPLYPTPTPTPAPSPTCDPQQQQCN